MKAKHFRKLRKKVQEFNVYTTYNLFGVFKDTDTPETVIGRDIYEAAGRYMVRHSVRGIDGIETTRQFGKIRIVPVKTPFERFAVYF